MSRYRPVFTLGSLLLLFACFALMITAPAIAQQNSEAMPLTVPSPANDLWRAVRQREVPASGTTQVRGVDSGVLITQSGEAFRNYRMESFIGYAGLFIGIVASLVLLFYLIRGKIDIPGGRSGQRVRRFVEIDRIAHWVTAVLFIVLAVTGLTLLFGRFIMLPIIGGDAFGALANVFKQIHDYLSPVFLASLLVLVVRFAAKNMPARGDLKWITSGGGIIGKGHASAGYFNAGEKIWFWSVLVFGVVVSVSGLLLLFPIFGLSREIMQLALIVHGIAAVLFIGGSFGHIYIGTVGTEGSLESMTTGYVDTNWAKAHHDHWYEEVKDQAEPQPTSADTRSASIRPTITKA